MKVTYTDRARFSGDEFGLLQQATAQLEELSGPSGNDVVACWDRDEHQQHYVLRLSDWSGEVSEQFDSGKLSSSRQLRWSLRNLWGDLLQVRSHKLLDKLVGAGEPTENPALP
jgi:hypothetical protein